MLIRSVLLMLSLPVAAVCVGAMSIAVLASRAVNGIVGGTGGGFGPDGGPYRSHFAEAA